MALLGCMHAEYVFHVIFDHNLPGSGLLGVSRALAEADAPVIPYTVFIFDGVTKRKP